MNLYTILFIAFSLMFIVSFLKNMSNRNNHPDLLEMYIDFETLIAVYEYEALLDFHKLAGKRVMELIDNGLLDARNLPEDLDLETARTHGIFQDVEQAGNDTSLVRKQILLLVSGIINKNRLLIFDNLLADQLSFLTDVNKALRYCDDDELQQVEAMTHKLIKTHLDDLFKGVYNG